ncbi:cell wall protein AWA1 isoform X2 [Oryzias latipes]|uniref:cell wall protein AWA1 isoform X2 n=1 Tax=Oryzias latipes TaxID=8090 RepID=UPI000CE1E0FD|nr:cell wall protein AWA1 isoform X2 [Oryzias latipes]
MEKYKPLLCIVFMTLSWGCIRVFAQNTTDGLSTTPAGMPLPVSSDIVTTSTKNSAKTTTQSVAAGTTQSVAAGTIQSMAAGTTKSVASGTTQSVAAGTSQKVEAGTTQSVAAGTTESVAEGTSQKVEGGTTQSVAAGTTKSVASGTTQSVAEGTSQKVEGGTTQSVAPGTTQSVASGTTQSLAAGTTQSVVAGTTQSGPAGTTQSMVGGTSQSVGASKTQSVASGTTQSVAAGTTLSMAAHTTQSFTMSATQSVAAGTTQSMTISTIPSMAQTTQSLTISAIPSVAKTTQSVTMSATRYVEPGTTQSLVAGTSQTVTMAATQSMAGGLTQSTTNNSTQTVAAGPTHNTLAGNNSTYQPTTTTAPPVSPNVTVETLPGNVSRNECGKTQLCAAEPPECDPSKDKSCFFLGAQQKNGQNFNFALSGQTDGYIAATVSNNANGKAVTYICANENKEVRFLTAILENDVLIFRNLSVNSVKGKVNGRTIQCTFLATVPDPLVSGTSRARRATGIALSVSTGSYNATSSSVGTPTPVISTKVDSLTDINATLVNEISPNTTASTEGNTTAFPIITSSAAAVPPLLTAVSNSGCGSEKLCAAEPSSCNPAVEGTCSFLSAKHKSGQIFSFELSGRSSGYIGSVFSPTTIQGNNDSTYVCANNNGTVKFITAVLNDNTLTEKSLNVTSGSVRGTITGDKIQCIFEATLPDTSKRAAGYSVSILSGTFNFSSGALGTPETLLKTNVVNLTDPTANVTSLSNINGTNSGVVPHHQPLIQALLVPVGVLALTILGH